MQPQPREASTARPLDDVSPEALAKSGYDLEVDPESGHKREYWLVSATDAPQYRCNKAQGCGQPVVARTLYTPTHGGQVAGYACAEHFKTFVIMYFEAPRRHRRHALAG